MGIVVGILLLSLLMLIHELGHYITGRLLGFKIIEFSMFMGPVLVSWTSKKTGIKYSIKMFPIGASVRFLGEESMGETSSDDSDAFPKKEKWKRAVVIGTGPVVNILSGIMALTIFFSIVGIVTTTVDQIEQDSQAALAGIDPNDKVIGLNGNKVRTSIDYSLELGFIPAEKTVDILVIKEDGRKINYTLTPQKRQSYVLGITIERISENDFWKITSVGENSNNGNPVLKPGDIVLEVEGVSTKQWEQASSKIQESGGQKVLVKILRDNEEFIVETTPSLNTYYSPRGIYFKADEGFINSVGESFKYSYSIVRLTFKSIGKIFTGEIAAKDSLSGPVGVVNLVGNVVDREIPASQKISELLWMFALISLNLGIFNLLPIPALDGSHLILIGVEAIRGKKLTPKVENAIVMIGFMLIISLAIMGLIFDIMRIRN